MRARPLHNLVRFAGTLGLLFALGGCSIPVSSTANSLPPLPGLNATTTTSNPGAVPATIYYLLNGRLVPVTRSVTALSPATLLTLLVQEPSADEAARHVSSALSPSFPLGLMTNPSNPSLITVILPEQEFLFLSGAFLSQAYAQIVYTLLAPQNNTAPVTEVAFQLGGNFWPPQLPSSVISTTPYVTIHDYQAIGPRPGTKPLS